MCLPSTNMYILEPVVFLQNKGMAQPVQPVTTFCRTTILQALKLLQIGGEKAR